MNFPWGHQRRFNAYAEYFKKTFGERVQKVSIDAGFTCPNRDGSLARGGCTYCNNNAFNPSYCSAEKPVSQQLSEGIEFHKVRYRRAKKYLAYFQTYSNTYSSIDKLRDIYEQALNFPEVVGLVIGTRPDCIDAEKLNYFAELANQYYIMIEYGVETVYNKTLEKINRHHTWEQSRIAIEQTAAQGLNTGAHFIFGLPGETREEMMESIEEINLLPLTTIKFHQLQIVKGTQMAKDFLSNPEKYNLFQMEEYIDFIVRFTERLNPGFIVERFTGEVPPRFHAGPNWGIIRNDQVNHLIEKKMDELNTWQGRLYT